jgi:hypothetical protein
MGHWDHNAITESSGIALSRKWASIAYVHNDENGPIHIVNLTTGECVGHISVKNRTLADPEDIDITPDGLLCLFDIGNNAASPGFVPHMYTIPEPGPGEHGPQTWKQYALRYPDGDPHNAETGVCWPNGKIHILNKEASGEAYELPRGKDLKTSGVNQLRTVATGLPSFISGAVAQTDGLHAFGLRQGHVGTVYVFDNKWNQVDTIDMDHDMVKPEGIGLKPNGRSVFVCDDNGAPGGEYQKVTIDDLYLPATKPWTPPQSAIPANPCAA